jgi:glycosyltransferase involved in cell wall biosynthesis
MNTPEAATKARALPALEGVPVYAIPNGFDREDFSGPRPRSADEHVFRIVHTGYLHTELGLEVATRNRLRRLLGGSVRGLNILARSHVYLLQALEHLMSRRPELASKVEIHLAGVRSRADDDASTSGAIKALGFLTHAAAVELMRSADLLFLPMHDLPKGRRASIVPGKTYEYLASGRPILGAVPDGDARDLLARAGSASLCRPTDVFAMTRILEERIDRWQQHLEEPVPDPDVVARFERRELTASLASVLDSVARPSAGASVPHDGVSSRYATRLGGRT